MESTDFTQKDDLHKKRRPRSDQTNRDFICPCGRAYLSYPALYTHIKQKHEGKAPGTLSKPMINMNKRGRPVNSTGKSKGENEEDSEDGENEDESIQESNWSYHALNSIEELIYCLSQGFQNVSLMDDNKNSIESLKQGFPKGDVFQNIDYYNKIQQKFEKILLQGKLPEEKVGVDGLLQTNCNTVFAIFIYILSQKLQLKIWKEMVVYVCLLRKALNEHGWRILNKINKNDTEFCDSNSPREIIEISNKFVTEYFLEYIQLNNYAELEIMKPNNIEPYIVKITHQFFNWIYYRKYTTSHLALNDSD